MVVVFLTLVLSLLHQNFACVEEVALKEVPLARATYIYIDGRQRYVTHENKTTNSTIICSNIYSISQISDNYKEQEYEQFLIITKSNISTIHATEFFKFGGISKLHLQNLHIKTISPGAFTGLVKLRELYLNDNELSRVSNGVYNALHRLEILNMTNNNIEYIENGAFIGLSALTELHLKKNKLSKVGDNFFETLIRVKYVDISENPLEEFPFSGLSSVEVLILKGTEITAMEDNLSNLTLKIFDLSHSRISKVDFSYFPRADGIYLSNNNITSVSNCQKLDTLTLDISDNDISTIEGGFQSVSKLNLSHNNFRYLDKSAFGDPKSLLVLDIGYNNLSNLDKRFFHNFTSLESLKLPRNNIQTIDPIFFQDLTSLTILDLSQNQIEEFQYGVFDSLKSLQVLDISGNKLKDLHQYTFNSLSNLRSLYFDNNQISSFDVKDLGMHLQNLEEISLDDNPWNCKELAKIEIALHSLGVNLVSGHSHDMENFRGIPCDNSPILENSKFEFDDLATDVQKALKQGVKGFENDFKNSKFVQYFQKDYSGSNFFKYFDNFKIELTKQESLNGTKTEKLTAIQKPTEENNGAIFVFSLVIQICMLVVLVFIVYLIGFQKRNKIRAKLDSESHLELC